MVLDAAVSVANAEVPVKVGLILKTALPVPVSSVSAVMRFADEKSLVVTVMISSELMSVSSSDSVSIEVLETLLLNTVQSAAVRQPNAALVAVIQVSAFEVFWRPEPVMSVIASAPKVKSDETRRFVDVAFVVVPFVMVEFVIRAFAIVELVIISFVAKRFVLEAFVVVPFVMVLDAAVSVANAEVPVKVGLILKTALPVPVSSVSAVMRFDDVNEPSDAALPTEVTIPVRLAFVVTLPAVSPDAVPVRLVATPDDGVPSAPLKVTNAPAEPTFTPSAVATPVPSPETPVPIGRPVEVVSVRESLMYESPMVVDAVMRPVVELPTRTPPVVVR